MYAPAELDRRALRARDDGAGVVRRAGSDDGIGVIAITSDLPAHPQGVGRGCKADKSATTTHRVA